MRTIRRISPIFKKLGKKSLIGLITLILVILPTALLVLFNSAKPVSAAWADEDWGYRKSIAITAHTSSENNVYISTTISNTNTLVTNGQLQSDCGDLRFTKQNGEVLPYYISSGCNSASTVVQVFFNTFPAGAQTIYFYYGNPSAVNGFRSAAFSTEATSYTIGSTGSEEKAPSPVAYWKFDDGTGTTAQDSTTNNNDGTISGATWQTEDMCVSGKCLKFDGTDDYTSVADSDKIDFTASQDFSISSWIKVPSSQTTTANIDNDIIEKWSGSGGYPFTIRFYNSTAGGSANKIAAARYDGTNNPTVTSTSTFNDNKWHHVSFVKSGSTLYLYVDGKQEATTTDTTSGTTTNSSELFLGRRGGGTAQSWQGMLDDLKIYNYARSAEQIKADYNSRANSEGAASVLGSASNNNYKALNDGLVGYWKMDQSSWNGTSGEVTDSSGNANNGTAVGNATTASGKFANGGTFDGTGDYVTVSSITGNSSINTTAAWIYVVGVTSNNQYIIDQGGNNNWIQVYNSRIRAGTNSSYYCDGSTTLTTNTWYHVARTFDGTTLRVFLNGVQDCSLAASGAVPGAIRIGDYGGGGLALNGKMDETRIYNRALSPSEVTQLYNFAPGPVAYYNFEEGTGTTANDRSGNANTGTLTNGPTWTTGKYGKALNFDGTDDCVIVGNSNSLTPTAGGNISVSTWLKVASHNSSYREIVRKSSGWFLLLNTTNKIALSTSGAASEYDNGYAFPADNAWHYVTGTFDGSTIKIYLDGVQVTSYSGAALTADTTKLSIGSHNDNNTCSTQFIIGQIDDVKIYNYARTQQQIVEDMNAGHPPPGSPVGSPVGHWKFDEGYSTTANNSGNGGSTINGTLTNMASPATSTSGWTQSGKVGKGLVFDGTNDYVAISDNSALSASNITVSAWVNPTVNGSNNMVVAKRETNFEYQFFVGDGAPNFTIFSGGTGTGTTATSSQTLSTGTWSHIVGTYDGATVKVYVNGRLTGSASSSYVMSDTNSPVYIGIDNTTTGRYFNGSVDEVKFYNFALTADQVKMDMNQGAAQVLGALGDNSSSSSYSSSQEYCVPGSSASCAAPIGRWDFEEGTGTSANDQSGNNLTGTLTNGPTWVNGRTGNGKALSFDGSNDYVTMGDTSIVDFGSGDFTLEAWVKLGSLTQGRGMIIAKDNSGASGRQFALEWDGNDNNSNFIRIGYFYSDPGQVWLDTANNIITDSNWHHISAGRSGNSLFVYVDGVLKASGTTGGSHASMQATASQLRVGNRQYSGATDELNGSIDQVRIYNYARSSSQIKWSYNKGAPVTHWKLDECQGTVANDSSGIVNGSISIAALGTQTSAGTCQTSSTAWGNGVTGKRNYSLNFDGTDDRVSFTVPSVFNLASGGSMTLSAWIKTSTDGRGILQLQNGNPLIYLQTGNTTAGGTANKFVAYIRDDTGTVQAMPVNGVTTVTDNNWHHTAFVIDNTNLYLYVDGRRETSTTWAGGAVTIGGSTGYLGDLNNATNWEFSGQIDDFRVYNYALTATQMKNLYNDGAANYSPVSGAP